jgi:hypothetical protein
MKDVYVFSSNFVDIINTSLLALVFIVIRAKSLHSKTLCIDGAILFLDNKGISLEVFNGIVIVVIMTDCGNIYRLIPGLVTALFITRISNEIFPATFNKKRRMSQPAYFHDITPQA